MKPFNLNDPNTRARIKQYVVVGIALGGIVILLAGLGIFSSPSDRVASNEEQNVSISRIDGVEAEDIWLQTAEGRIQTLEEDVAEALERNKRLSQRNQDLLDEKTELIREFSQVIDQYGSVINNIDSAPQVPNLPTPDADPFNGAPLPESAGASAGAVASPVPQPITSLINFTLPPKPSSAVTSGFDPRDTTFWLPAGAHAQAVITAGAAAPVGVRSQSSARPVVMRITSQAISASDENGAVSKTDIRGCVITGAARGDLSSERVYVRLQNMTCQREHGIIETEVRGFVAGSGQTGVRGPVISREGDLVQRSFFAGVLGGFGEAASEAFAPEVSVDGGTVANLGSTHDRLEDALQSGLANGVGRAGDRLSQYYIERAEQYQPVVNLAGGTEVEIVFLQGTWIDGRYIEPNDTETTATGEFVQ